MAWSSLASHFDFNPFDPARSPENMIIAESSTFGSELSRQQQRLIERDILRLTGMNFMGGPPREHFRMVRTLRKKFKDYSKEEFRNMSRTPVIKDILSGSHKLTTEEIGNRIKEHLDTLD